MWVRRLRTVAPEVQMKRDKAEALHTQAVKTARKAGKYSARLEAIRSENHIAAAINMRKME